MERNAPSFVYSFAKDHGVIALGDIENPIVGLREGAPTVALLEARRVLGRPFRVEMMPLVVFDRHLSEVYAAEGLEAPGISEGLDQAETLHSLLDEIPETTDLLDTNDDAPVIRLINAIISEAIRVHASDIHIEPFEKRLSIRLRIDGVLREVLSLPQRVASSLVSRIKVMSRLDIAEKRVPQDGRTAISLGGRTIDVRVSTLPSHYGERVVLRLLDKEAVLLDLNALGVFPDDLSRLQNALLAPNGIILVTGPTGSGKTTTLYAALKLLNDQTRNILTVEDPIEYAIDGIGQMPVNARVGMTFAAGLRAILRQDPDVVMVGEIRDEETAQIAVQASMTGHLVLSTVHTNNAISSITRLRDMGIAPFLLASTLSVIVAQRLVRRLCVLCREAYQPSANELGALGLGPERGSAFYRAKGCSVCSDTGYAGRAGLYEFVFVDDVLRALIHEEAQEQDLSDHAFRASSQLFESGARLVISGVTSIEEVLRVCRTERA